MNTLPISKPKRTGYDGAGFIAPGTVIERVYFAVPSNIVPLIDVDNDESATMADALRRAIANATATEAKHDGLMVHVTVDVRWVMKFPESRRPQSSQDTVAERFRWDSIADAQAHLDHLDRLS